MVSYQSINVLAMATHSVLADEWSSSLVMLFDQIHIGSRCNNKRMQVCSTDIVYVCMNVVYFVVCLICFSITRLHSARHLSYTLCPLSVNLDMFFTFCGMLL